ncbi:hypothetical protein N185_16950 [Sinorhizobium sp. GW3]|nr:hypothetical protein N185_16950 [Sinorhizobium sp. GW3]
MVVTRYGFGVSCDSSEIVEASQPVPDEAGLFASRRLFKAVSNLTADDLVIALISGGDSALLSGLTQLLPVPGMFVGPIAVFA